MSPDGLASDAVQLKPGKSHINLKPGKSMKITVSGTIASSTFLAVNLDPGNTAFADDVNPGNNFIATTAAIQVG
jgi:hypothetical protein